MAGYALCRLPRLEVSSLRRLFGTLALLNLGRDRRNRDRSRAFRFAVQSALLGRRARRAAALTVASLACLAIAWRGSNVTAAIGALALGAWWR